MKLYLGACLCLVAAACATNRPAEDQRKTWNDTTPETAPAVTPASDGASAGPRPMEGRSPDSASPSNRVPVGSNRTEPAEASEAHSVAAGARTQDHPAPATQPNADNKGKSGTEPDNTKQNKRDANAAALTPMDQGNGQTDLKITQQIRQAVIGDDSLSFTAKNVKIITSNGKVTLRGPVNTARERATIEAAARKFAGAAQVDNQLEVKN